jgi:hypothetical protein
MAEGLQLGLQIGVCLDVRHWLHDVLYLVVRTALRWKQNASAEAGDGTEENDGTGIPPRFRGHLVRSAQAARTDSYGLQICRLH